ncbi:MAG: diguanylate cyclase [Coxiellaceae bacterium]|nr:diguanylate cyclase [Coxiellaceae bacterium]
MKIKYSLTFKLAFFTVATILVTSFFVSIIIYLFSKEVLLESAINNLNNETRLIANNIENSYTKMSNDLHFLNKTPPIQGIIQNSPHRNVNSNENAIALKQWKKRLQVIFKSMLESNPDYTQLRYIGQDNNGMELVRVNQTNQGIHPVHDSSLQPKGSRDYFKKAISLSQGSVDFSEINYNVENGKVQYPYEVTLRALTPVYTTQQKVFGVLAINVNIQRHLRNIISTTTPNYDIMLYDSFGDFFIFDKKNKQLQYIKKNHKIDGNILGIKDISTATQLLSFIEDDTSRVTISRKIYSNSTKDKSILTIVVSVPKQDIQAHDHSLILIALGMATILYILAAFIVYLYVRGIIKPLSDMTYTIFNSSHHSEEKMDLPTHLNSEIGLLAQAFEVKTRQLSQLAMYDSLTGLINRKAFHERLAKAIKHSKRKHKMVCVLYIDINKFKDINDTYGHDYGDDLLRQFAQALVNTSRLDETCARVGGDEFAVIIQDDKLNKVAIQTIVQRYQDNLNKTYVVKGVVMNVLVAGGLSVYPIDTLNADELIMHADRAMYTSKAKQSGIFVRYDKNCDL